jgi:hypothetical protein
VAADPTNGSIATCAITEIELLFTVRSQADRDFLQVAEVTGQPTRWVADPGTID